MKGIFLSLFLLPMAAVPSSSLIYLCGEKYWLCGGPSLANECRDPKVPCIVLMTYPNPQICHTKQKLLIERAMVPRECLSKEK